MPRARNELVVGRSPHRCCDHCLWLATNDLSIDGFPNPFRLAWFCPSQCTRVLPARKQIDEIGAPLAPLVWYEEHLHLETILHARVCSWSPVLWIPPEGTPLRMLVKIWAGCPVPTSIISIIMTSNLHPHKHLLVKVLEISLRKFLSPQKSFYHQNLRVPPQIHFPQEIRALLRDYYLLGDLFIIPYFLAGAKRGLALRFRFPWFIHPSCGNLSTIQCFFECFSNKNLTPPKFNSSPMNMGGTGRL